MSQHSRYQSQCNRTRCRHIHLGSFDTPEDAAQAYLQHHRQEQHPEKLEKERSHDIVPPSVQAHLLVAGPGSTVQVARGLLES